MMDVEKTKEPMENEPIDPETTSVRPGRKAGWFCGLSALFGVIAVTPYLLSMSLRVFNIQQPLAAKIAGLSLLGGFCNGILFGVPAIILGILGWIRLARRWTYFWIPLLGILLSLGAIAGQVWFYSTCQFCQ